MEGRSSHDGGQRRGTDDKKAPGAGKRQGRRRERGQRSSNGPETTGEPSYPLAQGGDKEETSPTEATEKEATEVSASDYFLSQFVVVLEYPSNVLLFLLLLFYGIWMVSLFFYSKILPTRVFQVFVNIHFFFLFFVVNTRMDSLFVHFFNRLTIESRLR